MRIENGLKCFSPLIPGNLDKITTSAFIPFPISDNTQFNIPRDLKNSKITHASNDKTSTEEFILNQHFLLDLISGAFNEKNIIEQENFRKDFEALKVEIDQLFKKVETLNEHKNNFFETLKFLHINQDNLLRFLKGLLSEEDYDMVDLFLREGYDTIKGSDHPFIILQNCIKVYIATQSLGKLKDFEKKHQGVLKTGNEQKHLFDQLHHELSTLQHSSLKKSAFELCEYVFFKGIPFVIIKIFNNRQITKIFKQIYKIQKKCLKISHLKDDLSKKKKWVKDLHPKIQVAKVYQGVCTFNSAVNETEISPSPIDLLLKNKQADFKQQLSKAKILLDKLHSEKSFLDFGEFKSTLKQHGFDLEKIEDPPKTSQEWIEKFNSPSFRDDLCKRNVEYQMTMGKLIQQGLPILDKIQIENRFLIFNFIKNIVEIASSLFQMSLFIPRCAQFLAEYGIDKLEQNLPIPGIEYTFLINPDFDLSLIGLVYKTIAHLFGHYHKPHEYSLKGYWIDFQNKLAHVGYELQYALLFVIKCLLQLSDLVLDFCFKNKTSSFSKANSYRKLNEKLSLNRKLYQDRLEELNHRMNELKEKDLSLALNPKLLLTKKEGNEILRKYLADNHYPKTLLRKIDAQLKQSHSLDNATLLEIDRFLSQHHLLKRETIIKGITVYQLDKIQLLIDALKTSNVSLFPEDVKAFFNKNLSMNLEAEDCDFNEEIKKFFLASERSFFKLYSNEPIEAVNAEC